jgi:hypothetical protein
VFCEQRESFLALGETVLNGAPLYTKLRSDNLRELALRATDWLIELAGEPETQPPSAWWERLVEPTLAHFREGFGSVVDSAKLRYAQHLLASLSSLPLVPEQRDFAPWNVLVSADGELVVLDWESAEPRGLPALDLVYFLTYLAFFHEGAMESRRFRETYRTLLNPTTFTGTIVSDCFARYCDAIGLERAALHPLRVFTWLLHSRSEYAHRRADAGRRPEAEVLRRSVFLSLWEEELQNVAHI